jgi:G3E family GTPase
VPGGQAQAQHRAARAAGDGVRVSWQQAGTEVELAVSEPWAAALEPHCAHDAHGEDCHAHARDGDGACREHHQHDAHDHAAGACAGPGCVPAAGWGDRKTEVVLIARGLSRTQIDAELNACLLTEEEVARGPEAWAALEEPLELLPPPLKLAMARGRIHES